MTTPQDIEFGLDSFVYVSVDESGNQVPGDVVIRNTIEEAVLAAALGESYQQYVNRTWRLVPFLF